MFVMITNVLHLRETAKNEKRIRCRTSSDVSLAFSLETNCKKILKIAVIRTSLDVHTRERISVVTVTKVPILK